MMEVLRQLVACGPYQLDVLTMQPDGAGRHPVAWLVAGSRSGADLWQTWGQKLAEQGVGIIGVAQPGFGKSTGRWDFGGPQTMEALEALLTWTRRLPWVMPLRIGFGGYSSGATCACLMTARHSPRVLVGAAGVYDLDDWWQHAEERSSWSAEYLDAAVSREALRERSPLVLAGTIRCPVRLIHGSADEVVPPEQAEKMAAALATAGNPAELLIIPKRGHRSLQAPPFVDGLLQHLHP
ncbi:MAG: hypothetical protein NVS4B8_23630 [Herpetosiphon sp.]